MAEEDSAELVHIGAVAEQTGLSLRTLRHYDDVGLVQPSGRTEGGFRLYSSDDVERLLLIRRMKPLGFTLEEMAALLAALSGPHSDDEPEGGTDTVVMLLEEARRRRDDLASRLAMADEFIALLAQRAIHRSEQPNS